LQYENVKSRSVILKVDRLIQFKHDNNIKGDKMPFNFEKKEKGKEKDEKDEKKMDAGMIAKKAHEKNLKERFGKKEEKEEDK